MLAILAGEEGNLGETYMTGAPAKVVYSVADMFCHPMTRKAMMKQRR